MEVPRDDAVSVQHSCVLIQYTMPMISELIEDIVHGMSSNCDAAVVHVVYM